MHHCPGTTLFQFQSSFSVCRLPSSALFYAIMSYEQPLPARSIMSPNSALKILTRFSHSPASLFRCAWYSRQSNRENDENAAQVGNNLSTADNNGVVKKLFCIKCGTGFPSRVELEVHIIEQHGQSVNDVKGGGHVCPTCSKI